MYPFTGAIAVKFLTLMFVVSICTIPAAQAQVHFDSGSATPLDPERAVKQKAKAKNLLVRCQNGSRHTVRVCARHGGVAGR